MSPSAPGPVDELAGLHHGGELAAAYPRVHRLLAHADDAALNRAGQLLARLDPDEVLRRHPTTPALTVAVTGHGTLNPLVPALTAQLARHGLLMRPHLTDFDGYVFALSDPTSPLYAADPDLVLCVLDPAVVFDELPLPWGPDDVERVFAEKLALLRGLVARFAATARGTLVLNTLPLLRKYQAQLVDHRSRNRLAAVWREANAALLRLPESHPCLVVLDLDPLLAEGIAAQEPRFAAYTGAQLSSDLLAAYAREAGHLARHLAGRTRKVLVLDLDNTVWGGILGEDGPDGIEVAGGRRGAAFREFQRTVKQLASQGVLLAAVSKNDPEPVTKVLREHPEQTLREDDFVRVTANWQPKHDNLTALAAELGLGTDSFVFADDSDFERGLVRHQLPEVALVDLDDEPALHTVRLLQDGWFDITEATTEDRVRATRYREELARSDFLQEFTSLDDYLDELDVKVQVQRAGAADVNRVSQLTLRTNQFNLTTQRLQTAQVTALIEEPGAEVLTVRAADRFGDNGLVGAVFLRREDSGTAGPGGGEVLAIDNFVLSCRVFSRGIEQAVLSTVLRYAESEDLPTVRAAYLPTAKNHHVRDFFPRNGFTATGPAGDGGAAFRYSFADDGSAPQAPPHIGLSTDLVPPSPAPGATSVRGKL
ncbi:HAD-IIIC family phosphatase [Streptomyces sp. RKAG290]|uniref:HAD-IIIC family phosphatase n=1 Tax=Streptomyces sp. RKAG290 TaxID=2888348 RepID=UPI002033C926|nr:HAD-IIIC family phosphatase [Streptomyces sp. RKAG290]MCM2410723.1 HAD-IIIC family phosphatase [Streptomyces sp. RKAG290]